MLYFHLIWQSSSFIWGVKPFTFNVIIDMAWFNSIWVLFLNFFYLFDHFKICLFQILCLFPFSFCLLLDNMSIFKLFHFIPAGLPAVTPCCTVSLAALVFTVSSPTWGSLPSNDVSPDTWEPCTSTPAFLCCAHTVYFYKCYKSTTSLLFRIHWASWICGLIAIFKFGKYSAIIISNIFLFLPPLHTPREGPHWHVRLFGCSERPHSSAVLS